MVVGRAVVAGGWRAIVELELSQSGGVACTRVFHGEIAVSRRVRFRED